jgi:peptidoglycan/LPS O-acetylase OafA/YrhL
VVGHVVDVPTGRLAGLLGGRVLTWLGQRSYAAYLWHYLFATWLHPLPDVVYIPVGVAASLLVAHLSWVLVERRALRYSARFRPGRSDQEQPVPAEAPAQARSAGRRAA